MVLFLGCTWQLALVNCGIILMMKKRVWQVLLIGLLIGSDQLTKIYAEIALKGQPSLTIIKNFFYLTYAENNGAAWSILRGQLTFFIITGIIALVCFIYWYLKTGRVLSQFALSLIIAGTIGNMIDRLYRGSVRDFLDFYIFTYDFPIFNIADSCLTIGVILMILDIMIEEGIWFKKAE